VTPLPTEQARLIIEQAEQLGAYMVPMITLCESQLTGPQERLVFWAGLMAYLGGLAASGLGSEAVYAVSAMTEKLTSRVAAEKTAH
jgi:hypothetical protein